MNINDMALQLAEAIKNSYEYLNLKKAKIALDSNSDLRNKIKDFKDKEQKIINSKLSSRELGEKSVELRKNLEELSMIPEINNYLRSEKEFGVVMQKVFKNISSSIDSGLK